MRCSMGCLTPFCQHPSRFIYRIDYTRLQPFIKRNAEMEVCIVLMVDKTESYVNNKCRLDGNPEIDSHIRIDLCYLICLSHFIISRIVTNLFFFSSQKRANMD